MPLRSLLFISVTLAMVAGCGDRANEEAPIVIPPAEFLSVAEEIVKGHILQTTNTSGRTEFIKWGPHVELEGFYRCRYRVWDKQGQQRVYDDWFLARDGQVIAHVNKPRISKKDREELNKNLKSLGERLAAEATLSE